MNWLVDWSMQQTRLMLSLLFFLFILGAVAYTSMPREAEPDIDIPFVFVGVPYPGISPEDGERLIARPLEQQLRTIEGLKEITSNATQNFVSIGLEFDVNFDKEQAVRKVREAVDTAKADLPNGAEEPIVREFNTALQPVISVILYGDAPERTLRNKASQLKEAIEEVPSVLEAEIVGSRPDLLEIVIDQAKLDALGVTANQLLTVVSGNNRLVPAGVLDTGQGRFAVKVPGLIETRNDVLSLPLKTDGTTVVTLGDVAEIRRTYADPDRFARFQGEPAIAVQVSKRIGENVIDTIAAVRARVADATADWPDNVKVEFSDDSSIWINRSFNSLQNSVLLAILLVMVVVVAALGLRSGLLVGFAIPMSFLLSFVLLGLMGLTLNTMVMFGLILAVGMLVDGAIIVTEYAERRMSEGQTKFEAFREAASRMFWPIISSAATTVAAFLPMLFWPGVTGKFMSFFPITVMIVLAASTLICLLFLPVLGGLFGKPRPESANALATYAAQETGDIRAIPGITGRYARFMLGVIRRPGRVMAVALVSVVTVFVLFGVFNRGVEFFVEQDPEGGSVWIQARGNLSAEERLVLTKEVEQRVLQVAGIRTAYTATGGAGQGFGGGGSAPEDTIGRIFLELQPHENRETTGKAIMERVREVTRDIPGLKVEVRENTGGPGGGKSIVIQVESNNYPSLDRVTRALTEHLESRDTLREVDNSLPMPGIEWALQVDRAQAGVFGVDVSTVGATVQLVTNGIKLGEYRPDDAIDEVEIRVRFPADQRSIEALGNLRIQAREGLVPLSSFVTLQPEPQVTRIRRVDGFQVTSVRANTKPGIDVNDEVTAIQEWIDAQNFPSNVKIRFRGAQEDQAESQSFLMLALFGSLFLIGAILVVQFNNFWHVAVVLSAIIFSTAGVLAGMLIMGQKFSVVMSGIGIVALAGIIVNNNIVLVDTFQALKAQGMETIEAIIRTGAQRLRPVFLTTFTTMIGISPLMLMISVDFFGREVDLNSPDAALWAQMATAIFWGLGFGTLLTLIVTPTLLALPTVLKESGWTRRTLALAIIAWPWWTVRNLWRRISGRGAPRPQPAE